MAFFMPRTSKGDVTFDSCNASIALNIPNLVPIESSMAVCVPSTRPIRYDKRTVGIKIRIAVNTLIIGSVPMLSCRSDKTSPVIYHGIEDSDCKALSVNHGDGNHAL